MLFQPQNLYPKASLKQDFLFGQLVGIWSQFATIQGRYDEQYVTFETLSAFFVVLVNAVHWVV